MNFNKFPRTPHLFVLPGINIRDDKVLPVEESESFYSNPIVIEEKVDGANLGISLGSSEEIKVQNRGNYIQPGADRQFDTLLEWIYSRHDLIKNHVEGNYILFGEWCYYKHSIYYKALPDWFIGIDIFNIPANRFLNISNRNYLFSKLEIIPVPLIKRGIFNQKEIIEILEDERSRLGNEKLEGLYFRIEDENWLIKRAKVVRRNFIQNITSHWRDAPLKKNHMHIH